MAMTFRRPRSRASAVMEVDRRGRSIEIAAAADPSQLVSQHASQLGRSSEISTSAATISTVCPNTFAAGPMPSVLRLDETLS